MTCTKSDVGSPGKGPAAVDLVRVRVRVRLRARDGVRANTQGHDFGCTDGLRALAYLTLLTLALTLTLTLAQP